MKHWFLHATRIAAVYLAIASGPALADGPRARDIAAGCASCHGIAGDASRVSPALSGQTRDELLAKLAAFKSGERAGTVMPQLARGYSDTELAEAARWFSTPSRAK